MIFSMPLDTSPRARAIQTAIHRAMSADRKFRTAIDMSDFARKLAEAGFRQRHPDCPEADVRRRLAEELYLNRRRKS